MTDEGSRRRDFVASAAVVVVVLVEVNNVLQLFSFPFLNHITNAPNYYFFYFQVMQELQRKEIKSCIKDVFSFVLGIH